MRQTWPSPQNFSFTGLAPGTYKLVQYVNDMVDGFQPANDIGRWWYVTSGDREDIGNATVITVPHLPTDTFDFPLAPNE